MLKLVGRVELHLTVNLKAPLTLERSLSTMALAVATEAAVSAAAWGSERDSLLSTLKG